MIAEPDPRHVHRRRAAPVPLLLAGSTFTLGGAERMLRHLALGIDPARFDVTVLALREPGPVGEELRERGVRVDSGMTREGRIDPWLIPRLHRYLKRGGFRAIYFLDHAHAVFYGILASLGTAVRVRVMPVHTTGQWNGAPSLKRPIRLVRSRLDRIIAIAEAQREYLAEVERVPREQMVVIPNGIPRQDLPAEARAQRRREVRSLLKTPEECLVVGITAVLRPEKNHEMCLEAFGRVREALPQARLWIVGDGPRRTFLEREASRLLPAGSFLFLGWRSDAQRIMAGFDLAVLSSHPRVETLPLSLLEAMDVGLPVLSTRVGALHEMVEEGRSGLLVPPGDAGAFAAAMLRLLRDPGLRSRMGEEGRRIVRERYSVETMVQATEGLILGLFDGGTSHPPEEAYSSSLIR